jgi:hypothetical protein
MKFTQLIKTPTAEDLNNRVAQMFGSKINLESFTAEQLSTARDKLANQLLTIENQANFDAIHSSEAYQKNRLFLKVIEQKIEELQITPSDDAAVAEAPAAASLTPNQIEAFKKWYATYSKMQSKDVYNYAQGIFKAHMVTGVTNLDGASKQDPKGKAYDDLAKIFPDMDGDIEAIGHQLKSQGVDPLDMKAMAGQESAVAGESTDTVDETMSRQHFQYVADTLKDIQDPAKRAEYAKHHSAIFQHFNPNFDHAKFMSAAGIEMKEPAEAVAEAKPDFLDMDKDGDKKEPMKKAIQDKKKKNIKEGAEESARIVMSANGLVDKITGWMEDTAKMQTEVMLELGDSIRDEMGSEKSEQFVNTMKPSLESLYSQLETTRKSFTDGVAVLTGEEAPATLGADAPTDDIEDLETEVEPEVTPDTADDFTASEPATGGEEPADRKKRESIIRRSPRLAEMLSRTSKKKA